jgi:ABC-type branched-subunit amino acid transport system substrate-binding protein
MDADKKVQSAEYRVQSEKNKARSGTLGIMLIALMIAGCGTIKPGGIARIALLAPFEGRYQEVGYNAYYAVKLALADYGKNDLEFVAVDDGGSVQSAVDRARALVGDPLVEAAIVLGYTATNADVQQTFGTMPVLIVGNWNTKPETPATFALTNPQIDALLTPDEAIRDVIKAAQIKSTIVGNEALALEQFPVLAQQPQQTTVISSGNLPDTAFTERYVNSAEYTPQPGLLATLTYDATNIVIQAITSAKNGNVTDTVASINYKGLNGNIQFKDGYWTDAPIHYFGYNSDGKLVAIDRPIK